jgi:transcriptional regulator with XRE-family HTH domain
MTERVLGDYLHKVRIEKGLGSLRNVASKIGISAMYMSEIESGKKIPSAEVLHKISECYNEDYFKLVLLGKNSNEPTQEDSKAIVARMANGLSEAELQSVIDYMTKIRGKK